MTQIFNLHQDKNSMCLATGQDTGAKQASSDHIRTTAPASVGYSGLENDAGADDGPIRIPGREQIAFAQGPYARKRAVCLAQNCFALFIIRDLIMFPSVSGNLVRSRAVVL